NRRHVLEAVDPLLTFAPLTANIEHASTGQPSGARRPEREDQQGYILYAELAHLKTSFVDSSGLGTSSQDIHLVGEIVGRDDAHHLLEEAARPRRSAVSSTGRRGDLLFSRVHEVKLGLM